MPVCDFVWLCSMMLLSLWLFALVSMLFFLFFFFFFLFFSSSFFSVLLLLHFFFLLIIEACHSRRISHNLVFGCGLLYQRSIFTCHSLKVTFKCTTANKTKKTSKQTNKQRKIQVTLSDTLTSFNIPQVLNVSGALATVVGCTKENRRPS